MLKVEGPKPQHIENQLPRGNMVIEIAEHRERKERKPLFHGFRYYQLCFSFTKNMYYLHWVNYTNYF